MMRSPRYFAVAVRAPNGEIVLQSEPLEKTWIGRQKWLKFPFLRGSLAILDAMTLGSRAMKFASGVQLDPALQADAIPDANLESTGDRTAEGSRIVKPSAAGGGSLNSIAVGGALVFGIAFGLLIFKFLPLILSEQAKRIGIH